MPRTFRCPQRLASRLAWLAMLTLLLCAQFRVLVHAAEHAQAEHGPEDSPCALCPFQATGHVVAGPLSEPKQAVPPPGPNGLPEPPRERLRPAAGWPLQPSARGPPVPLHAA